MTAVELYKFVTGNSIEYHWYNDDVIVFIPFGCLGEFTALIGYRYFSEEPMDVGLKDDCICFPIGDLCEENDIELESVFGGENQ